MDLTTEFRKIRFVTTYHCVLLKQTDNMVFMQQLRYFKRIIRDKYPIKAFFEDLSYYLRRSMQDGFEIVLSLDRNENMRYGRIARTLSNLELIETL